MAEYFPENLRSLCADYSSIAQVCRDIGLNRQQFNRYLNGGGMPSAHNLRRIANYFEVSEADMFAEPDRLAKIRNRSTQPTEAKPARILTSIFENQSGLLRRYVGFYQAHFMTPTWRDQILRALVWLREQDGYIVTHTFERAQSKDLSIVQRTRYSGLATYRGNRIYVLEKANSEDGFLSETVLFPAHRQQVTFLQGMTMGVATKPRMAPYTSATIWKRLPERVSAREALAATGVFERNDNRIDPVVRKHFNDAERAK